MSKINKILQLMELVKKHSYVKKIKRKIRNNTQKCAIKLNFPPTPFTLTITAFHSCIQFLKMCACVYVLYTYIKKRYSAIKKEGKNAICSNMDGPRDYPQ